MTKKKRKINLKKLFISIIVLIIIILAIAQIPKLLSANKTMYLSSETNLVTIYNENFEKSEELVRGETVSVNMTKNIKDSSGKTYILYEKDNKKNYILEDNLTDSKDKVVLEKKLYIRTSCSILKTDTDSKILGLAKKSNEVEVLGYNKINSDGLIDMYKIKYDNIEGYVYGKYLTWTKEEAEKNYNATELDPIHKKVKNTYGGGDPLKLDYYPVIKGNFENNKMPESVYALYLNNTKAVINKIDEYIAFAKETKINTFVIEVKDDMTPGYKSKVMESLSPTNYAKALNSFESYKEAIQKVKDAGIYVVGRITTFKDTYYVKDHPEVAITSKETNEPYLHNKAYWPSPYSRDVWYFAVELAKEAVREMGFNEINFDYVRFPDRMQGIEKDNLVDLHNTYEEDKAEAIQRFLQYATDELHKINAYVSVDVFGESTNGNYVTAYGQYWPAISNVVDVISGMPYPDHFSANSYGIAKPWTEPYKLMYSWGSEAMRRQAQTTSPAIVRTWIEAYKSKYGNDYNADEVKAQVKGLFESGAIGGFITWNNSSSNLNKYTLQKTAFQIDYLKEFGKK